MSNYKALTAHLPFDITAEALAAGLLENDTGVAGSGQILIRPLGHLNRASGREVMQVTGSVFNTEGKELVYIDINREGLFDALPEMLFLHQEASYEDEVEKARHLARQEEMARRFFLPFEAVLYQTRIDLEQAERTAIKELAAFLVRIYGLEDLPDEAESQGQLHSFALALPFLNRVVGDLELTAGLLTAILRRQVSISQNRPQQSAIPDARQTRIGAGLLGIDLVLGDAFSDGIRTLQVAIGEVLPQEVADWLPGGQQRRFLEEQLFPYVLAAGEQVELHIGIMDAGCDFLLGDGDESALNVLGYTTRIK